MKPKDGFDKGPYKGYLKLHVASCRKVITTMVNPLRIGSSEQKEDISGSEIGAADTSSSSAGMAAAGSF